MKTDQQQTNTTVVIVRNSADDTCCCCFPLECGVKVLFFLMFLRLFIIIVSIQNGPTRYTQKKHSSHCKQLAETGNPHTVD